MYILLSIALAGLTVCGLLVLRHAARHAPAVPTGANRPEAPRRPTPVDQWQGEIRVDTRTDYPSKPMRQLMRKLRQEEIRQRPEEGRN
jgi:hypothetical protein